MPSGRQDSNPRPHDNKARGLPLRKWTKNIIILSRGCSCLRLPAHPDDESGQLEADGDDVEADDRPTLPRLAAASDEDAVKSCDKKQSLETVLLQQMDHYPRLLDP